MPTEQTVFKWSTEDQNEDNRLGREIARHAAAQHRGCVLALRRHRDRFRLQATLRSLNCAVGVLSSEIASRRITMADGWQAEVEELQGRLSVVYDARATAHTKLAKVNSRRRRLGLDDTMPEVNDAEVPPERPEVVI